MNEYSIPREILCVRVGTPPKDNGAYLQMFKTRENSQAHVSNPQEKTEWGVHRCELFTLISSLSLGNHGPLIVRKSSTFTLDQ